MEENFVNRKLKVIAEEHALLETQKKLTSSFKRSWSKAVGTTNYTIIPAQYLFESKLRYAAAG